MKEQEKYEVVLEAKSRQLLPAAWKIGLELSKLSESQPISQDNWNDISINNTSSSLEPRPEIDLYSSFLEP